MPSESHSDCPLLGHRGSESQCTLRITLLVDNKNMLHRGEASRRRADARLGSAHAQNVRECTTYIYEYRAKNRIESLHAIVLPRNTSHKSCLIAALSPQQKRTPSCARWRTTTAEAPHKIYTAGAAAAEVRQQQAAFQVK